MPVIYDNNDNSYTITMVNIQYSELKIFLPDSEDLECEEFLKEWEKENKLPEIMEEFNNIEKQIIDLKNKQSETAIKISNLIDDLSYDLNGEF